MFHSLIKGEKNDPSSIPILCGKAAKILEVEEKDLAFITTKNVKDFYRLVDFKEMQNQYNSYQEDNA